MRLLVVFPGRGSYGPAELGSLRRLAGSSAEAARAVEEVIAAMDAPRREARRPSIADLDAAAAFDPETHLAGENASALIVACALADFLLLERAGASIAGITGNSLGFYAALGASGALSLEDTGRLVEEMASLQATHGAGGQVIVPVSGDDWLADSSQARAADDAVAAGTAWLSVDLGSFRVLGARDADLLAARLPKTRLGGREYPMVLAKHRAFHTPLVADVADAVSTSWNLEWRTPRHHLLLGNGAIATPWSADPRALAEYTLREQVVTPFRLAAAIRTGLRELAPDAVVLTGPGESIGGSLGASILAEGWRGLRTRDAFRARQSADPVLLSLARPDQRARVLTTSP